MYKIDEDGLTGTVVAVSSDPEANKVWEDGIFVDEIPQPTASAGKSPVLKIDLQTKQMYYIYVDNAGNTTNDYLTRIKKIENQMKLLQQAVDDIIIGGML